MKYIALLRGINVGGNNTVPMKELKAAFEKAGYKNVSTYINSGNVLFESDETDSAILAASCEALIERQFGFPVRVAIISSEALKDALDHAPDWWGENPEARHNALFVIAPATAEEVAAEIGEIKPEYEKLYSYKNVIFWSADIITITRTRWAKIVGTTGYKNVTIRNANTARKLLELAFVR